MTLILTSSATGLIFLFFGISSETAFGIMSIVMALAGILVLEKFIEMKRTFFNGLDDGLLYNSLGMLIAGFVSLFHIYDAKHPELIFFIISLPVGFISALRYADSICALFAFISFMAILFFGLPVVIGMQTAKLLLSFATMLISFLIYRLILKLEKNFSLRFYQNAFAALKYACLVTLYAAGNYFVVRELSTSYFELTLNPGDDIPLAWFFYAYTILLPIIFVAAGLVKRNNPMLISGLLLAVVSVATIRYYYSILPQEWALTIGGTVMCVIALMSYLFFRNKKQGITYEADETNDHWFTKDVEAIVIAQIIRQQSFRKEMEFGGGEFGGGGAGGDTGKSN